jgi:LPS-assembly protein
MKDKFKIYIFFLLFVCFNTVSVVLANDFILDSTEITISENGNVINAINGNAKTIDGTLEIISKNFIYTKDIATLTATGGVFLKDLINDITINSDKVIFDKNAATLTATGDVFLKDSINNITIKSKNIIFNRKDNTIKSNTDSIIKDNEGNLFITENFIFTQNDHLIKINNSKIIDIEKNIYYISKAFINLQSNKLIGKNISINFNNMYFEKNNEPRLKGKTVSSNKNQTTITKGVFTTCKKNDDCPPWQLSAKEIRHDKNKKMIYYKDAWLKLYDKPVFYFPKFFHPDPTVKRQSGFLMPTFVDSSNTGASLNTPYYHVISANKDLTLKPRFYSNDKFLLQSEFRHIGKKSNNLLDFSFLQEKNASSKNHFFLKNKTRLHFNEFEETELLYQIQQVSNDTYLKTYKLDSPLIDNQALLTSSLRLGFFSESLSFNTEIQAFEDLNKPTNDRYEFVYPSYQLSKRINKDFTSNGELIVNSSGFIKNYNTNVFEKANINDLIFNTNYKITNNGLKNNFNFLIKNVNSNSKNSTTYKNRNSNSLASIVQYNTSYPLIKKGINNISKVNTRLNIKFSPNDTKKMSDANRRLDINNIYNLNRISSNDTVEGGTSLTYGSEYIWSDKDNRDIFQTSLANVLRFEENENLPNQSGLNKKTSDIVGNLKYRPNNKLNLNYNFSLDNNLNDYNYQQINTEFKVNNFVTSFEYLNENKTPDQSSYLTNNTSYLFNDSTKVSFERRDNKKTDMTEFYNLVYQYRNDCLIAAIEYNKDYYSDRDMKPEENIFFKLTITPFGETSSPNLLQ